MTRSAWAGEKKCTDKRPKDEEKKNEKQLGLVNRERESLQTVRANVI